MDGDVLTIDVQKAEGKEAEEEQDGVKCAHPSYCFAPVLWNTSQGMTDAALQRADRGPREASHLFAYSRCLAASVAVFRQGDQTAVCLHWSCAHSLHRPGKAERDGLCWPRGDSLLHSCADQDTSARRVHRSERSSAFARRQLRLPDNVDPSQIKAEYKNGTLDVEVRITSAWACRARCCLQLRVFTCGRLHST